VREERPAGAGKILLGYLPAEPRSAPGRDDDEGDARRQDNLRRVENAASPWGGRPQG
jgi:hypothetical protein